MMSPGRKRLLIVLCCILILGAPLLLFRDVLGFQFLNYDDDIYVTGNPIVHSLDVRNLWAMVSQGYFRSYQPLTLFTHAVDYALWGDNARGHHLTNLLLHVSNGLLLFWLTVLILRVRPSPDEAPTRGAALDEEVAIVVGAAVAALLFAIHPLRVESVAWISDRKDLLMSFFLLPSCAAYLLSRNASSVWRQRIWLWSSVGLFACAVLAKTVAVVFPLVLVSLDLFLVPSSRWRQEVGRVVRSKAPYFALSLFLGLIALSVGTGHTMSRFIRDLTFTEQLLIPAYSVGIYLTRTVVPVGLTPVYSAPPLGILAGITAAVVLLTIGMLRVRSRPVVRNALLAGSVFLLFVLPTMVGIVAKTGIQPWADRYLYAASIPLFLLIGGGTASILRYNPGRGKRPVLWATSAGLVVAIVLSVLLVRSYLPVWSTSEGLWRSVIAASPELSYGYNNLGAVLMARGETDSALASYRTAQQREPSTPGPWFNMGLAFADVGRSDSAAWCYRKAIGCDSTYVDAYTALGTLALSKGDTAEARRQYEAALLCDPTSAKAHHNIGILCYQQGEKQEAMWHFEQALASEPFSIRVLLSLGVVYSERGEREKARRVFRDAARLGSPEARQVLAAEHEPW